MSDLTEKRCMACEGGVKPLTLQEAKHLLQQLQSWVIADDGKALKKTFNFKNYYQTLAFVNAVAWIAHQENHHPDLLVTYNQCVITYTTHAVHALSENDFICAAKVDGLSFN